MIQRAIIGIFKRKITIDDNSVISAIHLTLRQSLLPNALGVYRLVIFNGIHLSSVL